MAYTGMKKADAFLNISFTDNNGEVFRLKGLPMYADDGLHAQLIKLAQGSEDFVLNCQGTVNEVADKSKRVVAL